MSIFGPLHHRPAAAPLSGSLYRATRALQLGPLGLDAGIEVRQAALLDVGDAVAPTREAAGVATPPVARGPHVVGR